MAKRYVIRRGATLEETMDVFGLRGKEADKVRALVEAALDHIEHSRAKRGAARARRGAKKVVKRVGGVRGAKKAA